MRARIRGLLRDLFTRNVELKFLALVVALGLFYAREREETADRALQVDVMTTGEEAMPDRIRVSPLPPKVEVTLRGPARVLAALRADNVGPVSIRIRDAAAVGTVRMGREMLDLPDGVRVLGIEPPAIRFRFEERADGTAPVVPEIGSPAPDLAVDAAATTVDPSVVAVSGARSSVERIRTLGTAPIDVSGWSAGTYDRVVAVAVPDLPHLRVVPQTVRVRVTLAPDRVVSERSGIPVEIVRGTDLDERGTLVYGAEARRAKVRIEGLRSAVESLPNSEIRLFVRLDRGSFSDPDGNGLLEAEAPVEAETPGDRWTILEIDPPTFRATYVIPPADAPAAQSPTGSAAPGVRQPAREAGR